MPLIGDLVYSLGDRIVEVAKEMDNRNMADILAQAADKDQMWLDDNRDTAKSSEIALKRRQLARRIESHTK